MVQITLHSMSMILILRRIAFLKYRFLMINALQIEIKLVKKSPTFDNLG